MDGNKGNLIEFGLLGFIFALVLLLGIYFVPWSEVKWGQVEFAQPATITVRGEAKTQQQTQIASFSAGASAVSVDKDAAIAEVNKKVEALLEALQTFGIPSEDIKTQNLNVYQQEESYYDQEAQTQRSRPGQWRVSNSVEVKLRDINRASDLSALLTSSGATNVYGPNFTVDDTVEAEAGLLEEAIANARKKAEEAARSSGKGLGEMVSISEGEVAGGGPIFAYEGGGGGGAPLEPGTSTVTQRVMVTFELR